MVHQSHEQSGRSLLSKRHSVLVGLFLKTQRFIGLTNAEREEKVEAKIDLEKKVDATNAEKEGTSKWIAKEEAQGAHLLDQEEVLVLDQTQAPAEADAVHMIQKTEEEREDLIETPNTEETIAGVEIALIKKVIKVAEDIVEAKRVLKKKKMIKDH
jgi:hypothetical protein